MAIDLQKLEQKFNALFEDENIVNEFEQWLEARNVNKNSSKPIVSGSLPGWAAELLTEVRFRLLIDIDTDGEPRSSMAELLEMWGKVNKALDIKTIGQ